MITILWQYNEKCTWTARFDSWETARTWLRLNDFDNQKNSGVLRYAILED